MLPKSPIAGVAEQLVFGNSLEEDSESTFSIALESAAGDRSDSNESRVSMYVSLFEGARASRRRMQNWPAHKRRHDCHGFVP